MENGIIDGAMVTKMSSKVPLEPEVMIARNKKDIINASGSKYCPVEISNGLEHILENEGRYAVVGLPCHLHGLRLLERKYPRLKKQIVIRIGLFCKRRCDNEVYKKPSGKVNCICSKS